MNFAYFNYIVHTNARYIFRAYLSHYISFTFHKNVAEKLVFIRANFRILHAIITKLETTVQALTKL